MPERFEFQFHYGAVLSGLNPALMYGTSAFQFHYGAVLSSDTFAVQNLPVLFQFHYGAVLSIDVLIIYCYTFPISIPLWCGSESSVADIYARFLTFQFHYGAVLSVQPPFNSLGQNNFNSTMVRF